MATTAESGGGEVLRSERIAGGILPPVLNTFDMVAIFVAIVLFISNSAILAGGAGPSAYFYWVTWFYHLSDPRCYRDRAARAHVSRRRLHLRLDNKAFGTFLGFSQASARGGQEFWL